jgi:hypothetical protein
MRVITSGCIVIHSKEIPSFFIFLVFLLSIFSLFLFLFYFPPLRRVARTWNGRSFSTCWRPLMTAEGKETEKSVAVLFFFLSLSLLFSSLFGVRLCVCVCLFELMDILTLHFSPLYCYLRFAFRCLVLACNNTHTHSRDWSQWKTDRQSSDDTRRRRQWIVFFFPECGHHGGSAECW